MNKVLLPVAIALGLGIAYFDSRPTWDDTGITVVTLFAAAGICGVLGPRFPWLWALCIGLWTPLFEIPGTHNYGPLFALVVAFLGAYAGMAVQKIAFAQPAKSA